MKLNFSKRFILLYSFAISALLAILIYISAFFINLFLWWPDLVWISEETQVSRLSQGGRWFMQSLQNEGLYGGFLAVGLYYGFLVVYFSAIPAIFLLWLFVKWVASTAEKSSRSYVGFMVLAIFFPFIAWILVLTFKKPENRNNDLS
jgi:hypothetical protein